MVEINNKIQEFMSSEEKLFTFFVYSTEICVQQALLSKKGDEDATDYTFVDSLPKLALSCLSIEKKGIRSLFMENILNGIVITLTKDHQIMGKKFNQLPYFRIFLGLISVRKRIFVHF
jgi:hypothetical protein